MKHFIGSITGCLVKSMIFIAKLDHVAINHVDGNPDRNSKFEEEPTLWIVFYYTYFT